MNAIANTPAGKKILHLLSDGPDALAERIAAAQARDHAVEVVDLAAKAISYDELVLRIVGCDRVVCW